MRSIPCLVPPLTALAPALPRTHGKQVELGSCTGDEDCSTDDFTSAELAAAPPCFIPRCSSGTCVLAAPPTDANGDVQWTHSICADKHTAGDFPYDGTLELSVCGQPACQDDGSCGQAPVQDSRTCYTHVSDCDKDGELLARAPSDVPATCAPDRTRRPAVHAR